MFFTSLLAFHSPFSDFLQSSSSIFLFFFCSLLVMDFPTIPDGLGDDFGDFDDAGVASFSFEDFNLGDVAFA